MEPEPGGGAGGGGRGGCSGDGGKPCSASSSRSPPLVRPSQSNSTSGQSNGMTGSAYGYSFSSSSSTCHNNGGGQSGASGDTPPRDAAQQAQPPPAALPHYSSAPNVVLVSQFEDLSLSTHSLSSVAGGDVAAVATSASSSSSPPFPPARASSIPAASAMNASVNNGVSNVNNLVIVPNGNGRSKAVSGGYPHGDRLLDKMESFFRDQKLCDVVLIAGDTRIPTHR